MRSSDPERFKMSQTTHFTHTSGWYKMMAMMMIPNIMIVLIGKCVRQVIVSQGQAERGGWWFWGLKEGRVGGGDLWLTLTAGRKVKKLYFWLLMTFLGYLCSLFSGWPSHTVRGRKSPMPQHLDHGQHLRNHTFNLNIGLIIDMPRTTQ